MSNLRLSYWWLWTILSTGMGRSTVWKVFTDVSEKRIFRVEEVSVNKSIDISCTAEARHQSAMLSSTGVCLGPYLSFIKVLLAHLPLLWYSQSCTYCLHSSTPMLSPALLECPGTKSIICTVFKIPNSVSAGLCIRLCHNWPIQCEEKWWTFEGIRKEGQNREETVSELLGEWSLNRSSLAWNSMGKNQRKYMTEIF